MALDAGDIVDYTYDQEKNRVPKQRYMDTGSWVDFQYDSNGNITTKTITPDAAPDQVSATSTFPNGSSVQPILSWTTSRLRWRPFYL